MPRKKMKRMGLFLVLYFGLITIALFIFLRKPEKASHQIRSPLFYDYPLEFTSEEITIRNGNPNHPNTFSAQISQNCGAPPKLQYGIKVFSSEIYGTSVSNICLNVETGFLKADISISGMETHYALPPPEQGGNYYDYLTQLANIKEILNTVAQGCYFPEEGFRSPPRPELKRTVNYIDKIAQQLQNSKTINSVIFRLPAYGSHLKLGTSETVAIEYRASQARDIRIRFRDKVKTYYETKIPAKTGGGVVEINIPLPLSVEHLDSTCIKVCITPKGGNWAQKLDEYVIKKPSKSGDYLWELYLSKTYGSILYAGKSNLVNISWQVLGTRKMMVRVFNERGNILGSRDFLVTDGAEHSRNVDLSLLANTPRIKNCKIVARIVPQHGTWSEFLSQKELPVQIE